MTSVDREGIRRGFDLDMVSEVAEAVGVPVVAHGGAGRRSELASPVRESGASSVAAGSLFMFQGQDRGVLINYPSRSHVGKLLGTTDEPTVGSRA